MSMVRMSGLGCEASKNVLGGECDRTLPYMIDPLCWTKSQQEWQNICAAVDAYQGTDSTDWGSIIETVALIAGGVIVLSKVFGGRRR